MRTLRLYTALMVCALFNIFTVQNAFSKSVYAVASHANGKIKAYSVDPNSAITYQTTIKDTKNFGVGAGGLCLWPEKDRMFVNYESPGIITWASIKNLSRNPATDKCDTGMGMPGGMVVDEQLSRLYIIQRGDNKLYAFNYNSLSELIIPPDRHQDKKGVKWLVSSESKGFENFLDISRAVWL